MGKLKLGDHFCDIFLNERCVVYVDHAVFVYVSRGKAVARKKFKLGGVSLNSSNVADGNSAVAVCVTQNIAALFSECKAVILRVTLSIAALFADDGKTFDFFQIVLFLVIVVTQSAVLNVGYGSRNFKLLDISAVVEKVHRPDFGNG